MAERKDENLKELFETDLLQELFLLAYKQAEERGELWWRIRVLEELGWYSELRDLILENEEEIEASEDIYFQMLLAMVRGDHSKLTELRKESALSEQIIIAGEEIDDEA